MRQMTLLTYAMCESQNKSIIILLNQNIDCMKKTAELSKLKTLARRRYIPRGHDCLLYFQMNPRIHDIKVTSIRLSLHFSYYS